MFNLHLYNKKNLYIGISSSMFAQFLGERIQDVSCLLVSELHQTLICPSRNIFIPCLLCRLEDGFTFAVQIAIELKSHLNVSLHFFLNAFIPSRCGLSDLSCLIFS